MLFSWVITFCFLYNSTAMEVKFVESRSPSYLFSQLGKHIEIPLLNCAYSMSAPPAAWVNQELKHTLIVWQIQQKPQHTFADEVFLALSLKVISYFSHWPLLCTGDCVEMAVWSGDNIHLSLAMIPNFNVKRMHATKWAFYSEEAYVSLSLSCMTGFIFVLMFLT